MADDKKPNDTNRPTPSRDKGESEKKVWRDDSREKIQSNTDTTIMESRPTPRPKK